MVGFAWEAEVTYFALKKHVQSPGSEGFQAHVETWRNIMEWETGLYLREVVLNFMLERGQYRDLEPELTCIMLESPFPNAQKKRNIEAESDSATVLALEDLQINSRIS